MLITKIERQKKNRKRYNIYLDEEFYCGLYDDTILKYGLRKSDDISEKKISEIKDFDEYIYGKKTAYDYLSYRIRTVSEIKKKLKSNKISEGSVEKVLKHLSELGLTNDTEFATQLVLEKIKRKHIGKKLLKQKLFEKGVPKSVGDEVLEKIFYEVDEKELALESFRKYLPRVRAKSKDEKRKKVYDYLMRKGFDYEVINQIIYENIK